MATNTVTWNVTSQSQTRQFDTNGNPIEGKTVVFKTSTGYEGSVFVPESVYSDPAKVREMINTEVQLVAGVHGLTGSVTA